MKTLIRRIADPLALFTPLIRWLIFLLRERRDLIEFLRHSSQQGIIGKGELAILEGTLRISSMRVREIMIPRSQMTVVHENEELDKFLPHLINSAHSRFPVVNGEDRVLGILLAKDLIPELNKRKKNIDLKRLSRPAIFIPESKRLNVLLDEFRNKRLHMAIILDEYGLTAGLVTIEDVLEEIVGEIEDEHDTSPNPSISKVPFTKSTYRVKANTSLNHFNNYFATQFSHKEAETIGGLLLDKFQKLPEKEDQITVDNMIFEISKRDERRIQELIVNLNR